MTQTMIHLRRQHMRYRRWAACLGMGSLAFSERFENAVHYRAWTDIIELELLWTRYEQPDVQARMARQVL